MSDIKKRLRDKVNKLDKWTSWMKSYLNKKYWVKYKRLALLIKPILDGILILLLIFGVLFIVKIINININPLRIEINDSINISEPVIQQLVMAQISVTFLITAVLSLVANLENVYIYGEKARNNIFKGKIITFSRVFIILIILMFFSILMMIKSQNNIHIFISVISALFILVFLTFKMIRLFLQKEEVKKELMLEYYRENVKVWKKSVPTDSYSSLKLNNLRERYLFLMLSKDIEYVEFDQIYLDLIDKLLFNNRQKLQEYYTEPITHSDLISDYIIILNNMIKVGEIDRAIQCYNKLLNMLNYYNIYIPYFELFTVFENLNMDTYNLKNEFEIRERVKKISHTSLLILRQSYICTKTDFSYTRIGKLDNSLLRNVISNDIFAEIYDSLYHKTKDNKDKLTNFLIIYDEFRMSSFYLYNKMHDITNFNWKYKRLPKMERDISIIGTVVASLLLRILKNNDEENFKLFLSMNINPNEMLFAYHVLVLSIIQAKIKKFDKNPYTDFYSMDLDKALDIISKNNIVLKDIITQSNIENIHESIKENCIGQFDGGFLIDYRFNYTNKLIKIYFEYVKSMLGINTINNRRNTNPQRIIIKEIVEKIFG